MFKSNIRKKGNNISKGSYLISSIEPSSANAEQFRTLRTNIEFAQINKNIKVILVTSSIPEEGKSTISANLAFVMAQTKKKILLVDADLRKPTVHKTFKRNNEQGLTNLLLNSELKVENVVSYIEDINLHVLCSGPIPPNPSELLGSIQMTALIEEMKTKFDFIIIDVSPITAVTDGLILSSRVDSVLLVARYGYTRKEDIRRAQDFLEGVDANLLGYVMNRHPMSDSRGYYAYYGHSKKDI